MHRIRSQIYSIIVRQLLIIIFLLPQLSAQQRSVVHPEWSRNLSIYEANIRQYTPEGTFAAFEEYLPQLKDMGVGIIWLMPIHPIGVKNRKGTLGSYYSVKDYRAVNPEFGTLEDFRHLVNRIHELGMVVIIDWVANHTAWDHPWTQSHPEWYNRNILGQFTPPVSNWTDVIGLDYSNTSLRNEMVNTMKFWVREYDIDGFRCDVAAMVPSEFWVRVRKELDEIKPVFMLAEAHEPRHHEMGFDMTYGWQFKDLMNNIAQGKKTVRDLDDYYQEELSQYHPDAYRMIFTSNHDENSWNGTVYERLGDAVEIFAVFSGVFRGMPLIYSGQEAGMNKALAFFDKDQIDWKNDPLREIYTTLNHLKRSNHALWNGTSGGDIFRIKTTDDKNIYCFIREKDGDKIFAVFNFSDDTRIFQIESQAMSGQYTDPFTGQEVALENMEGIMLKGWEYLILSSSS